MQNIKVGTPVYHYRTMKNIGNVIEISTGAPRSGNWTTEGTTFGQSYASVRYPDGTVTKYILGELMRADLD
jgi:hypothetical protein